MSDLLSTFVAGAAGGIVVESIHFLWADHYREYRRLKRDILHDLVYYANFYSNPIVLNDSNDNTLSKYNEAGNKIRDLASRLRAFVGMPGWITIGIPSREKLERASELLMGLSNSFIICSDYLTVHEFSKENRDYAVEIRSLLCD